jgi:DNA-directed RNA polymerase specialized sigma24 family protein
MFSLCPIPGTVNSMRSTREWIRTDPAVKLWTWMADPGSTPLAQSPYLPSPYTPPPYPQDYTPAHARTEPQASDSAAESGALLAYLDTLPTLENQVLKSIYFDRRNLRQTAELLGLPVELVAAAMSRALRAVGRLLDAPVRNAGEVTG